MNNVMIDLMRGCLLVLVIICVGGGGIIGFAFAVSPHTPLLLKMLAVGGGLLVGLIVASIVTGICYLLININDNLEKLANQQSNES
ncbi:hypothetical protein [Vibrio sp. STUT-A11]|uniref:hypothetical protein n=1 Tax=Vibrio sp. STUT-A11 TaxID=2976236 RepID=UPI00222EB616|nr:hypothetical protein [Vibrio sp. STUT-A11]BDR13176.1 hypothetical protein VspSTUT11_11520 [Vibrio sp. STUT-A11]